MKYNLLCFAIGLLLGIFLGLEYCVAVFDNAQLPAPVSSPEELRKEVSQFETAGQVSFESLKKQSKSLESHLSRTKSQLHREKERTRHLQRDVSRLLKEADSKPPADSNLGHAPPDFLPAQVSEFMGANTKKDSLYERVITTLDDQIFNKDSMIYLQKAAYSELKMSFEKSLVGQTLLAEQNRSLQKECKRQKVKSKVLSTALFVLSGAAATYLLRH